MAEKKVGKQKATASPKATSSPKADSCGCGQDGNRKPAIPRSAELKADVKRRLARIEGQVRGICRMIDEDTYCDDILAQVAATKSALDAAALLILEHHLRGCVAERFRAGDRGIVEELKKTIDRMLK
jgi:CsoR family transcriptional regulator, copper-sensing transcriptional repressor